MDLQRSRVGNLGIRLLKWALLLGVLTSLAVAQDAGNPAAATAAKPAPSATGVRPDSYVSGAEDVLSVYVWKEPDMSKTIPVRPDGMISLPLVGEIKASGYTPVQLQEVLAESMKKLISDPQVTVVGEVGRPGYFPLTRRMTVLDAIAMAGGFKDFAKTKKIYVLRTAANGTQERLPFNYKDCLLYTSD